MASSDVHVSHHLLLLAPSAHIPSPEPESPVQVENGFVSRWDDHTLAIYTGIHTGLVRVTVLLDVKLQHDRLPSEEEDCVIYVSLGELYVIRADVGPVEGLPNLTPTEGTYRIEVYATGRSHNPDGVAHVAHEEYVIVAKRVGPAVMRAPRPRARSWGAGSAGSASPPAG